MEEGKYFVQRIWRGVKKDNMKKIFIAMVMAFCSLGISAQTENGFREIEVQDNFYVNPFTFFQNGLILAAGDKDSYNAMTIGWGSMGTIWGRSLPLWQSM